MINYFLGDLGHFFVVLSFVAALIALFSFFFHTREPGSSWFKFAKITFWLHAMGVFGVITVLYIILSGHHFEYHYAFSHSSRRLPFYYMISSFWEGQEGSFLLWSFWHVILGIIVLLRHEVWTSYVLAILMAVQAFLASMILGVEVFDFKIGSSPFILLRDALNAPIFELNPDFIPEDGSGLNPLLQNYWMVIHPPTLFLGFATTVVPFAYCLAGLWKKDYTSWIKPALPWALFSAMVLGVGILMGAYWAYETLNFGGYWNWDPVENAVYIPWLTLVASYHVMVAYQKSKAGLKAAMIMVIVTFVLILYSTFLTRSGILGDASVHSFTDLGLSGQLLIYLFVFLLLSIFMLVWRWKQIPFREDEPSVYSGEFWVFLGATLLGLMAFQVLIPTSIPVFNNLVEIFGVESNLAPPADQIAFYTNFQLWFAIVLLFLTGTAQLFWWKRIDATSWKTAFYAPAMGTLILSALIILIAGVSDWKYILIITVAVYSVLSNGKIILRLINKKTRLSGGAIAHIGLALMVLGILTSSGYSNIVSLNNTGLLLVKDAGEELNKENVLLWYNEPRQMGNYRLTYKGAHVKAEESGRYLDIENIVPTNNADLVIVRNDVFDGTTKIFEEGDSVEIRAENTYYRVEYLDPQGKLFTLYPRAQINEDMGGLLASPDIRRDPFKDLYTHVSLVLDPRRDIDWSEPEQFKLKIGDSFLINDFVARLENVEQVDEMVDITLQPNDVAIKATIVVEGREEHVVEPVYLIRGNMAGKIPDELRKLGLQVSLDKIIPDEDCFLFTVRTTQKDYIIMKAIEKPLINILWLGTFVLVIGFVFSIRRRYLDNK